MSSYVPPPEGMATQHEGTEGLAINNTAVNPFMTILAMKTTAKLYSRRGSSTVRISPRKIVKTDPWFHLTEAATMKFVSEHTSIPVPKRMIKELQSLKPKGNGVSSCVGGSLRDSRIPRSRPRLGPFISVNEFHLWLRDYLQPAEHSTWGDEQEWEEIKEMAAKQDGPMLREQNGEIEFAKCLTSSQLSWKWRRLDTDGGETFEGIT
ncbi:hypothetical protein BDW74DRAFT_172729 [Aspergillus multicolor]|uniref:uncharacterized protein n=1 Tax=Aspergillus multicolor TaxID=41759 RepID=UPI003CCD6A2E